ncbi:MAG: tripartite tricarboxylate transporter substrate-binding protein [Deltaproteobacteria bacterium]|nr:tripartite tricarboxylate transporter substrate-binding protein [Deltaproteobacteria bacterium]
MLSKSSRVVLVVLAAAALLAVAGQGNAQQTYPTKPVQLVPAGSPGGGLDIHARAIEQALTVEKLLDKPFTILHKGGGGGNLMTSHLINQKGNGYTMGINSNRVLLNELMGTIEYGYKDLTSVARLTTEYNCWAVRADSKYKSALDVLADLQKDPTSVTFGVGTVPSNDQFNIMLPAKQKGVDYRKVKIVAFDAGGDAMAKLLGNHVPILSTGLSEAINQAEAGKVRILSVSAPAKLDRVPTVPCWKDLGIDVAIYHWRGIYGPPEMPKEAYDYWNKKFAAMVKTKTWKQSLDKFELFDAFLTGDDFKKELAKDYETYRELLGTMGMLKKGKK